MKNVYIYLDDDRELAQKKGPQTFDAFAEQGYENRKPNQRIALRDNQTLNTYFMILYESDFDLKYILREIGIMEDNAVKEAMRREREHIRPLIVIEREISPILKYTLRQFRNYDEENSRQLDIFFSNEREFTGALFQLWFDPNQEQFSIQDIDAKFWQYFSDKFNVSAEQFKTNFKDFYNEYKNNDGIKKIIENLYSVVKEWRGQFRFNQRYIENESKSFISQIDVNIDGSFKPLIVVRVNADTSKDEVRIMKIVRIPSTWLYQKMYQKQNVRNISMVLHSITAETLQKQYPQTLKYTITQPYEIMKKILQKAAEKYGFNYVNRGYNNYIITIDKQFTNIWKEWSAKQESESIQYCVSCFKPSTKICQKCRVIFCSEKCFNKNHS